MLLPLSPSRLPTTAKPSRQRHHVVLALDGTHLHALALRHGLLGWRETGWASQPLDAAQDDATAWALATRALAQTLQLPAGTVAYWVLPPDVLGVVSTREAAGTPAPDTAGLLPFAPHEVRSQVEHDRSMGTLTCRWLHADWLRALQAACAPMQWTLADVFAREQAFSHAAGLGAKAARGKALVATLEHAGVGRSDTDNAAPAWLHIHHRNGACVRSAAVRAGGHPNWADELTAAAAAAGLSKIDCAIAPVNTAPVAIISVANQFGFQCLDEPSPLTLRQRLRALWQSSAEGICIQPQTDAVRRSLLAWSIGLALLGAAAFGALRWHQHQLEKRLPDLQRQVRAQTPELLQLQRLRESSLFMSQALQTHEGLGAEPSALNGAARLLQNWPADVTLLQMRLSPAAGQGADAPGMGAQLFVTGKPAALKRVESVGLGGFKQVRVVADAQPTEAFAAVRPLLALEVALPGASPAALPARLAATSAAASPTTPSTATPSPAMGAKP